MPMGRRCASRPRNLAYCACWLNSPDAYSRAKRSWLSYVLDRTIDVHIARVRRKLGENSYHLTNRQGYGYCFEE